MNEQYTITSDWREPVHHRTAADFAYSKLYARIISGELPPGERINQDIEAEQLQLSRMPIREALRRLASEGLVIIQPHRGVLVRPLSISDLEDLYVVRISLEGLAGRLGALAIDQSGLQKMRDLIPVMEDIVESRDLAGWLNIDWEFHRTLYEAAESPRLMRLIFRFREEAKRYRFIGLSLPEELTVGLNDHHDMLQALETGSSDSVEHVISTAMRNSKNKLIAVLREQGDIK